VKKPVEAALVPDGGRQNANTRGGGKG